MSQTMNFNNKYTQPKGTVRAVIGGQWGDEGKGKLVDLMARQHQIVCRYNGGSNAGHSIVDCKCLIIEFCV